MDFWSTYIRTMRIFFISIAAADSHNELRGHELEKMKTIFNTIENIVSMLYSTGCDHPPWADQVWMDTLRKDFTKYLMTISVCF